MTTMATQSGGSALPAVQVSWRTLAGALGIVGVLLFVIGVLLQGDVPMPADSAQEVRDWYANNGDRFLLGGFLCGIAVILCFVPFFCYLRQALASAEGGEALWSRVAFLGAVLFVVMGAVQSFPFAALAADASALEDDSVVVALHQLGWLSGTGAAFALIPFFLGVGFVSLQSIRFPTWLGLLSLALAAISLVASAAMLDITNDALLAISIISFLGLAVVILALSVTFLRTSEG